MIEKTYDDIRYRWNRESYKFRRFVGIWLKTVAVIVMVGGAVYMLAHLYGNEGKYGLLLMLDVATLITIIAYNCEF